MKSTKDVAERIAFEIAYTLHNGKGTNQQKLLKAIMKMVLPMTEQQMTELYAHLLAFELLEVDCHE